MGKHHDRQARESTTSRNPSATSWTTSAKKRKSPIRSDSPSSSASLFKYSLYIWKSVRHSNLFKKFTRFFLVLSLAQQRLTVLHHGQNQRASLHLSASIGLIISIVFLVDWFLIEKVLFEMVEVCFIGKLLKSFLLLIIQVLSNSFESWFQFPLQRLRLNYKMNTCCDVFLASEIISKGRWSTGLM